MSHTYVKLDANTIEVTNTTVGITTTTNFTFNFLTSQKLAITKQKNEQIAARDLELAEVNAHLAKCLELNIVALPVKS